MASQHAITFCVAPLLPLLLAEMVVCEVVAARNPFYKLCCCWGSFAATHGFLCRYTIYPHTHAHAVLRGVC